MLYRVILIDVLNKPSPRRMHGTHGSIRFLRNVGNVWNSPWCDLPKFLLLLHWKYTMLNCVI
jgi:hypothetical protein